MECLSAVVRCSSLLWGVVLDYVWSGTVRIDTGIPFYSTVEYDQALAIIPAIATLGFLIAFLMRESYCRPVGE